MDKYKSVLCVLAVFFCYCVSHFKDRGREGGAARAMAYHLIVLLGLVFIAGDIDNL